MSWDTWRPLQIFAALFAGLLAFFALEVVYLLTAGGFLLLTGVPTPGGAPIGIHVMNLGVKGFWAALVYGLAFRVIFGRVNWLLVAGLWCLGLLTSGLLAELARGGAMSLNAAVWTVIALYWAVGLFLVRDRPAR